MDAQTLIIVFGFAWGAWIIYGIHKRRSSRTDPTAALVRKSPAEQAAMPRLGKPGTITYNQKKLLQGKGFNPDNNWSQEEAATILDGVRYLRAICSDISSQNDGDPPLEIQNALLKFILTEQDIRDYIRKWGEDRRNKGMEDYSKDEPLLVRNRQYDRVKSAAHKYLTQN